nr:hypothetical protein [Tanacetum cinerariifolium]
SSIRISPRVEFSPHDPIIHRSGHDIYRGVKGSLEILKGLGYSLGSSSSCMISMNITSPSFSLEQINFVLEDWRTNSSDSSIEFSFRTCSMAMEANGSGCECGLDLMFSRQNWGSTQFQVLNYIARQRACNAHLRKEDVMS